MRLAEVQPEFKTPIWDYLGFLVDEQRVADGRAMMRQYEHILGAAERRFGVDRHVIAAVWGVETDYGREAGDSYLPHALATLVCEGGRRTNFWRGELIAALKLVGDGDLRLDELFGSWAGAFGQTQFIPSTYQRLAVDFDGDGRRDLVKSTADAIGSVANYYKSHGWRAGAAIAVPTEVDPRGANALVGMGIRPRIKVGDLKQLGVTPSGPVDDGAAAAVFMVQAQDGPRYWLGLTNFHVITRYNPSVNYALAVHELAQALRAAVGPGG